MLQAGGSSDTGGVKPMSLQGRLYRERERLTTMTDEERKFRAQWLKDQEIGLYVPNEELKKVLTNPIRRFYRFPLDRLEAVLTRTVGQPNANLIRNIIGRAAILTVSIYAGWYYFKYNTNDWTRKGGWRVTTNKPILLSIDEGYPSKYRRSEPADYASRGFKNSPI